MAPRDRAARWSECARSAEHRSTRIRAIRTRGAQKARVHAGPHPGPPRSLLRGVDRRSRSGGTSSTGSSRQDSWGEEGAFSQPLPRSRGPPSAAGRLDIHLSVRRNQRLADGWVSPLMNGKQPSMAAQDNLAIDRAAREAGRDPREIRGRTHEGAHRSCH